MSARALCLLPILLLVGCGGGGSSPTSPTIPPSAGLPFTVTDLVVGTGAETVNGQLITVAYTGWLYSANAAENKGQQFDSSPGFQFTLGVGQVIAGWDQGFSGMRVGGQRRLLIPPELAYGTAGAGSTIPPNATLIFDVELLSIP